MKIIVKESQIKEVIKYEEKKQLNESLSLLGWIFTLSLGSLAIDIVSRLYKKYKRGDISKKQLTNKIKDIKRKDNIGYYDYKEKDYEEKDYKEKDYNNFYIKKGTKKPNIVIGDPQASIVASKSKKANLIGRKPGEGNLWYPGATVSWLKDAIKNFEVSPDVKNVIICIGTNGGFNLNDDVSGLFTQLYNKFPNANFYTVQGSWGKGSNVEVDLQNVEKYYNKFNDYSNIIGSIGDISDLKLHPHNPKIKSYNEIANEIDRII